MEEEKSPQKNPYEIKSLLDSKKSVPSYSVGPLKEKKTLSTQDFKILLYNLIKARHKQLQKSPESRRIKATEQLGEQMFHIRKSNKELADSIKLLHRKIAAKNKEKIVVREQKVKEIREKIDDKLKDQKKQKKMFKKSSPIMRGLVTELKQIEELKKKASSQPNTDPQFIKKIDEKIIILKKKLNIN